jgi:hypothetical protein
MGKRKIDGGPHTTHCCFTHQYCKYGDGLDCPVVTGAVVQAYEQECCDDARQYSEMSQSAVELVVSLTRAYKTENQSLIEKYRAKLKEARKDNELENELQDLIATITKDVIPKD